MYRLSFLLLFASGLLAQVEKDGVCNLAANAVQNLDLTKMLGTWHQIGRIANQNETGDCTVLSLNGTYAEGKLVGVEFSMTEIVEKATRERRGNILNTNALGVYALKYNDSNEILFAVLAVDYDSQIIFYSCVAASENKKLVWAWQYHRNATITNDQKAVLNWITSLDPDLNNVTWKNTQDASVCQNKGVLLTPGILVMLLVASLMSFMNSTKYLSSLKF